MAAHRRASVGSQTLSNIKERLADLDKEGIDLQLLYPNFLLHINSWDDGVLGNGVCRAYNTWFAEICTSARPSERDRVGLSVGPGRGGTGSVGHQGARFPRHHDQRSGGSQSIGPSGARVFFAEADRLSISIAIHFSYEFSGVREFFFISSRRVCWRDSFLAWLVSRASSAPV